MDLKELARNGSQLVRVLYRPQDSEGLPGWVDTLVLEFESGVSLVLLVDAGTDEFRWSKEAMPPGELADLADVWPLVRIAYGSGLLWSWEMVNHQGYFDAIQMEFRNPKLDRFAVFQFVVTASQIHFYEVRGHQAE